MKKKPAKKNQNTKTTYQAPLIYPVVFYGLLAAWTLVCAVLLGAKAYRAEWNSVLQWFMVIFIVFYTWYFSVGISYRIAIDDQGTIELTSLRRVLHVQAEKIPMIEGPPLPIGFVKLRLTREKAYLFCLVKNPELIKVLKAARQANPAIQFKNLIYY
jgi:energy-coupling factor transporter transmembrane protein EcfT